MGVNQLFKVLHKKSGKTINDLGNTVCLSDLKDQRICVDASGFIYSSLLGLYQIDTLTDEQGNPTGHVNTI